MRVHPGGQAYVWRVNRTGDIVEWEVSILTHTEVSTKPHGV